MENLYILAIDQSTSATKVILFNQEGLVVDRIDISHRQIYPRPGWVEHDPIEIYTNTLEAIRKLFNKIDQCQKKHIIALALTNQRETALVWDRKTGDPVYNAIVWQCQRGESICKRIASSGLSDTIRSSTGLILSPYFSASKIGWILENIPGLKEKAKKKELACGTIDSWLIWKLTGGRVHTTDYSNASRTQLFNIKNLCWDEELLNIFGISLSMMPTVLSSNADFGETNLEGLVNSTLPIVGVLGDSHAALFAQACFDPGMAKATYGTGSSIMMNIGSKPILSNKGIVTSIAWAINNTVEYVFEGNINYSGAIIQWLINKIGLISSPKEASSLAVSVEDTGGVFFVPAFTGLGAPYWDSAAKAAIIGMSQNTEKAHIVRAAEESMAYQVRDILEIMIQEGKFPLSELRTDGGPTKDSFLMQFQADILGIPVNPSAMEELSAAGVTYMAGITKGVWSGKEDIKKLRHTKNIYKPSIRKDKANLLYREWRKAVSRVLTQREM